VASTVGTTARASLPKRIGGRSDTSLGVNLVPTNPDTGPDALVALHRRHSPLEW